MGRPGAVATQATYDLVTASAAWPQRLAADLKRAATDADVDAALDRWADGIRKDASMTRVLYETGLRLELAGQLMVRDIELGDVVKATRVHTRDVSFLELPFEDAIATFLERAIMQPDEFYALRDRYKAGAFTATNLAGDALKERARDAILASLQDGRSLEETIAMVRDGEAGLGVEPASHDYLDNVVRTNVATAYGAGRIRAMTSESVLSARPFWVYYTARDSRVRSNHLALDGQVFEAASEVAYYYSPPLGFRCRCVMSTLSADDVQRRGAIVQLTRIAGVDPDVGFEGRPEPLA